MISGVLLGGAHPDDFLIGDRCQQPVAAGSSCEVGVRFAPEAQGARSATLTLLSNATIVPHVVTLSGGASSQQDPAHETRAGKSRSEVELIGCPTIVHSPRLRLWENPHHAQRCEGEVISGEAEFTSIGASVRATLTRGGFVYATGARISTARARLVLTVRRAVKPGTYMLTLRQPRRHEEAEGERIELR